NKLKYQYMPVPWNYNFTLQVYVKNAEDGTKILEQILPFFTPQWTTTINLIDEMDVNLDIPVTIGKVTIDDSYDTGYKQRRMLIYTVPFQLKGYLYGPIRQNAIILVANTTFYIANTVDIHDSVGRVEPSERVILTPGLDANGNPV